MDQVMMPIATSAIVADLKTNVGMVQAALSLVSLVAAPLYVTGGKLGDIQGKKRMFVVGLVLYTIGVLAAALAPSVVVLIGGWSIVRALGMVLAIPASIGLLIASYPDEGQRGQAFALYGVGAVAAALVGPLLMGISAEALSWRVPFGLEAVVAVATILMARSMTETEKIEGATVDWGGTVLAFFAIAAIILGSMLGGRYGWWQARRAFDVGGIPFTPFGLSPAPVLIGLGAILGAILLSRSGRMEERAAAGGGRQPLFSLRLFDNRTLTAAWMMATLGFIVAGALPF
jgi:MFS family permease